MATLYPVGTLPTEPSPQRCVCPHPHTIPDVNLRQEGRLCLVFSVIKDLDTEITRGVPTSAQHRKCTKCHLSRSSRHWGRQGRAALKGDLRAAERACSLAQTPSSKNTQAENFSEPVSSYLVMDSEHFRFCGLILYCSWHTIAPHLSPAFSRTLPFPLPVSMEIPRTSEKIQGIS